MDNVTHTLVGLALAESGLKRRTRYATAVLLLGANLPDVDGFAYFFGSATGALAFRRGWTHGALAMVAFPLLLTAAVLGWHRLRVRRRETGPPPVDARWVLALAAMAVLSHPLLDLLNTYGVRLLMPFSGRWFYGDTLFIIDPWLWLALITGIILTRRRARRMASHPHRPIRAALGVCAAYVAMMALSSRIGAGLVQARAVGPPAQRTLVSPVFLTPLRRMVVRDLGTSYEVGELAFSPEARYVVIGRQPAGLDEPGVRQASATPAGADFLSWARFPYFHVERQGESLQVLISDMRYGRGPAGSWAAVRINVPGGLTAEPGRVRRAARAWRAEASAQNANESPTLSPPRPVTVPGASVLTIHALVQTSRRSTAPNASPRAAPAAPMRRPSLKASGLRWVQRYMLPVHSLWRVMLQTPPARIPMTAPRAVPRSSEERCPVST